MFTRPRCRQFEPLVTAQIRLRNLIRITGINFHCDDDKKFSMYYTLHLSAFSKPFYTSEKLDCRSKVEWPEINCPQMQSSTHKFICIRVWKRDDKGPDSMTDKLLTLWGVYFSGLVSINNQERTKYKENTLLFHLYGGIFTSCDQIINQPDYTIPESQSNCDQNSDKYSTSSNFSITNGSNNKISPDLIATSPPRSIESGSNSYKNESVTVMEILNESKFLKVRYIRLDFPKSEIQPSYTLERLLKLQEIQRWIKAKQESSQMLADRIGTKSAACLNLELIMSKPVFYEPQKQTGMGRTLSLLLSQEKAQPKPETIMKEHELRVKVECARFRIKLLTQQRDKGRQFNRNLERKREKLKDENTEKETMIWNSLRTLSRENAKTPQDKLILQKETIFNINMALADTRRCLLRELNEIYHITRNSLGMFTINNIHLPDAESYGTTTSTSTEISIALGYVSHAVLIVAKILNIPLRNPIKHEGSRSKIYDNIKILPPSDRIFPLFCRVMPPSNVLLYGVYLLNQNISQLKHVLGMNKGDLRATLANLLDLMNCISCEMSKQFNDNTSLKQVDHSTSSVDSAPLNMIIPRSLSSSIKRVSRSLEDFDDLMESFKSKLNTSAPDLTQMEPYQT